MPMSTPFDGRANTRGNQQTPATSVPDGRSGGGKDSGGTPNLRASPESPATSVPSPASGSNSARLPFDTYEDRSV